MTLEYILLLVAIFGISLRFMVEAPKKAFHDSGPRLAARVEKHIATGTGFSTTGQGGFRWEPEPPQK
jgi:hypothetical protein